MSRMQVALRVGVVVLLVGSAWSGIVAGLRRWRPCADGFETPACLVAQSHETANLVELAVPEAVSYLLLGGGLLLLALLGRLPVGWRLVAVASGPVCWAIVVLILTDVGKTEVALPPTGGYETTLPQAVGGSAFVLTPFLMVGVGMALLRRSPEGSSRPRADRTLGHAWLAAALGWPLVEFFVLGLVYASHDAAPGAGLWRSALTVVAAALVLRTLVVGRRPPTWPAPSVTSGAAPGAAAYPGSA